ncbi:hypothetical protein NQD34_007492 [Periophthalmus magnuspinnatus]|nr:hypothetical protein NQD34_007492 [Periophthalmus magnuspinnatus]
MALPPDPAPFTKLKKKKKKNEVTEGGGEERNYGDEGKSHRDERGSDRSEGRSHGSKDVKKQTKRKRGSAQMESEEKSGDPEGSKTRRQGDKERDQGEEELTRKKKKKRSRENGTQPERAELKETTPGNEMKKKLNKEALQKNRVQLKEEGLDMNISNTQQEIQFSNSELLELEEFIPNVQSKSLEVKQKLLRYDLPRFREFKRKGLKLRWGRYSEEENLQIRRNVEDFLKLTLIQTPEELFFPQRFPEREHSLRDVRANHRFYQRIAEGLLRTCDQVYVRSKKIFDPRNHMGRFSEDELQALQKLHTIHGNDWKTIANKLERSIYACEKRHAQIGSEHGPWTPEEMHRLKRATKKHLKRALESSPSPGLDLGVDPGPSFFLLCSKLPWKKISQKVKSRSPDQCRRKWFSYLKSRLKVVKPQVRPEASARTRVQLIQILYQLQVEDVSDVDWIQVAQSVGGVTPMCMQRLFHRMKVSRVLGWTRLSFGEIVDNLFQNELPMLLKKINFASSPDPGPARFSLDHLFPPEDEVDSEVDNS